MTFIKKLLPAMLVLFLMVLFLCTAHAASVNLEQLRQKINLELESLNAASLNEEEKKERLQFLNDGLEIISKAQNLKTQKDEFTEKISSASQDLTTLKAALAQAKTASESALDITDTSKDALSLLLEELSSSLSQAWNELNEAKSQLTSLQSLPGKAQELIANNNVRLNSLTNLLLSLKGHEDSLDFILADFEISVIKDENSFIQEQLASRNILLDLTGYQALIANEKILGINSHIEQVRMLQSELLESSFDGEDYLKEAMSNTASFTEELSNRHIINTITRQLAENDQIKTELGQIEAAIAKVCRIDEEVKEQLSSLKGSLVLSRLLYRQQQEIPVMKSSFNFDEYIPALNLNLYDLKVFREKLFDEDVFISSLIARAPKLSEHKEELKSLIAFKRSLIDELSRAMTLGAADAVNLKLRFDDFKTLSSKVQNTINDHLFWLSSNPPLSPAFFKNLPKMVKLQAASFLKEFRSPDRIKDTAATLAAMLIPLMIIGFISGRYKAGLKRLDDKLALRLDKSSDGILITPWSLLINLLVTLPKAALTTGASALFIVLMLDGAQMQFKAVLIAAFHILIFSFILEILKPNGAAQRHFGISPKVLALRRRFIDSIYLAVLPVLIIADIRALDPAGISADTTGLTIVLILSAILVVICIKGVRQSSGFNSMTLCDKTVSAAIILCPLSIFVMLSSGYYYTAVELINRAALSFYTISAYILLKCLSIRTLAVIKAYVFHKNLNLKSQNQKQSLMPDRSGSMVLPFDRKGKPYKQEILHFDFINISAFKVINSILLCLTAVCLYLQWNDLAGVLGYLDNFHLWETQDSIAGSLTVTGYLSLADILFALLFLAATWLLNRRVPSLLEKLFLLRSTDSRCSTSYTARILTSYLIIATGLTLSAGALGISWNNLQWLVAALSVGLGFGLQEIFGNFVSGLIILFERQIRVGDIITLNNLSGTVSKIRIRATTIVSFDNKEVMIPNKSFITSALTNWSLSNTVTKLEFTVIVPCDCDLQKAREILRSIILSCSDITPDKSFSIYVTEFTDKSITLTAEVYVSEISRREPAFDYLCCETASRFEQAGIKSPVISLK